MFDFDNFGEAGSELNLSEPEKAAAILLAMGRGVAGKLLKYFTQAELQAIIQSAQRLRSIPPNELITLVNEFEDLFSEGTGLMDNARAIESILEEGLTPDEVDGLLGRRATFQAVESSIWDQLENADPAFVGKFLINEHPQTIAYIMSMLPSSAGARVLMEMPESRRPDILNRTVNLKQVSPKAAGLIENRVREILRELDAERNSVGSVKVAEMMNELEKTQVEGLLDSLEALSTAAAKKVRPKIFLFEDLLAMPQRSRVALFNDISADVITMALRDSPIDIREAVLSSIGARQRRMIESDLGAAPSGISPRAIAVARRSIAQEAIRLASNGQIQLKENNGQADAA
jgi:flagellar motor switch protein FliG